MSGFAAFIAHPEHADQLSRLSDALAPRIASVPGLVLVDVRTPGEVALGTVPGARPISLPSLFSRLDELDATAPTAVFCAGANALPSPRACCDHAGFVDVLDLVGGHNAWAARTQDLTTTAGAK